MVSTLSASQWEHDDGLPPLVEPKGTGYRDPAPHKPAPPPMFYVTYQSPVNRGGRSESVVLVVDQYDLQSQVEARLVEIHLGGLALQPPLVFYGHMSRPTVQVEKTFRVEYK